MQDLFFHHIFFLLLQGALFFQCAKTSCIILCDLAFFAGYYFIVAEHQTKCFFYVWLMSHKPSVKNSSFSWHTKKNEGPDNNTALGQARHIIPGNKYHHAQ